MWEVLIMHGAIISKPARVLPVIFYFVLAPRDGLEPPTR